MIDWRTILKAPAPLQNIQNRQNGGEGGNFADIAHIAEREAAKAQAPTLRPATAEQSSMNPLLVGSVAEHPLAPPIQPGRIVAYTDRQGRICGGWDERSTSTVMACHGVGRYCQVELSSGQRIPLWTVRAVTKVDPAGNILAAWDVNAHGYDGEKDSEKGASL